MSEPIRILVTDDHAVVREGLRALIEAKPDMAVVGEAADGREAVAQARDVQPDVVLMDLVMPHMGGVAAIREIRQAVPAARVLVLTSFGQEEYVIPAIRAGALGYLLKDAAPQELEDAIRSVHRGERAIHPSVARTLATSIGQEGADKRPVEELTPREIEVVRLVARGMANQEIASELTIAVGTVRYHMGNVLSKLGLDNRTQVVLYALREGYASLDNWTPS
jgi:NarL family two-component system response regulator LiaR